MIFKKLLDKLFDKFLDKIFNKIKGRENEFFGGSFVFGLACAFISLGIVAAFPLIAPAGVLIGLVMGATVVGAIAGPFILMAIVDRVRKCIPKTNPATVPVNPSSALLALSSVTQSYGSSHSLASAVMVANPIPQPTVSVPVPQSAVSVNLNANQSNVSVASSPASYDDEKLGAGQYAPGKHHEPTMTSSPAKTSKI